MRFAYPWKYWDLVDEQFQSQPGGEGHGADEYDFRERPQPKERARGGRTPQKTRNWERDVQIAAAEQAPDTPLTGRISLRLLFLINSVKPPKHDISNAIKSLEDALNRRAYHDDSQIDHLEALRVWGPDEPNRIVARVYEQK